MSKILLIDDDPDVLTVLSKLLKSEGYEVVTASRREEALQQLTKEAPALVLLDVLLSGTDGRELCREIKATYQTQTVPVLMFSGHPGAAQQYQAWGADGFIAKPFNTQALLQKMQQMLNQ